MTKYCDSCRHKLNTRHSSHSFESSVPWDDTAIVPQTTYCGDTSTSFNVESQVKVPLYQAIITGTFIGTNVGIIGTWLASLGNLSLDWYVAIPSSIFLCIGLDWLRRDGIFQPEIKIEEVEAKSNQPPIEISVTNEGQHGIKRRPIESASNEQVIEWAKAIKLDFRIGPPDLAQARFGGSGKIFSQPAYAKFQKELSKLGLIEKVNPGFKNSKYELSQAGYNFVDKVTSDYNLISKLLDN